MSNFGVTPNGFVPMRQQDVLADLNAAVRASFGGNLNLAPASVFGQMNGIWSERLALLWEALEDVYQSQSPNGAEGVSVDNILALNGLTRLTAAPTRTNPAMTVQANGVTLYGLVFFGTAGTTIPAGSLILTNSSPTYTFKLDGDVAIGSATSAVQSIVFSNTPTTGSYTLTLQTPSGTNLTTVPVAYSALAKNTLVTWNVAPTSGSYRLAIGPRVLASLPYNATPAALQAQIALDPAHSGTVVTASGTGYLIAWGTPQAPVVSSQVNALTFSATPTTGSFGLTVAGSILASLPYTATAAQIQAAISSLPAYSQVSVSGSVAAGFFIVWGQATPATVTVSSNTTGVTITAASTDTVNQLTQCVNSLQAAVNAIYSPTAGNYPFTDVAGLGSGTSFTLLFGANTPVSGQPVTAAIPIPTIVLTANSMNASGSATNINLIYSQSGGSAQGTGTATCTVNGPNFVAAGTLSVIGSPISGWASVTNQLDCLTGSNTESDTAAITRFSSLRAAQANGSMSAVLNAVGQVALVDAVIGFQNLTNAAHQLIEFASIPTTGTWAMALGDQVSASLPFLATAAQVQAALNGIPLLSLAKVTGTAGVGFDINFSAANGGQAVALLILANNTTDTTITFAFGQPPKSFQVVADGGADADIANAIAATAPAGIATYGAPVARTLGTVTASSATIVVASAVGIVMGLSISGSGIPAGTTVTAISGTTVTMSVPAMGSYASTRIAFGHAVVLRDAYNNPNIISFSRPQQVLIYATVQLTTDLYLNPGDNTSGLNPVAKFKPQSIAQIQSDIVNIINAVPIGGLIIARGTSGLVGCFDEVPGIIAYSLEFGTSTTPTVHNNVQLLPTQKALGEVFITNVSFV